MSDMAQPVRRPGNKELRIALLCLPAGIACAFLGSFAGMALSRWLPDPYSVVSEVVFGIVFVAGLAAIPVGLVFAGLGLWKRLA